MEAEHMLFARSVPIIPGVGLTDVVSTRTSQDKSFMVR